MQAKNVENFIFKDVKVSVFFNKKPTKSDLEDACINFLKKVQEQKCKMEENKKWIIWQEISISKTAK